MLSDQVRQDMSAGSVIRKMFEEGERQRRLYGAENVFDFSLGNPDLDPPVEFRDALKKALDIPGVHKYMPNAGYADVRELIAEKEAARSGLDVRAENVIMTVGAAGALNTVLKSLLNPQDEVIVLAPYFLEYLYYIKNFGGKAVIVKTQSDTFEPAAEAVAAAVTPRTRAIILNTPNNPSGAVYSEATLSAISRVLCSAQKRFGTSIFAISDEPYSALCYEGEVPSILKFFRNGIIGNSYSKSLSLPGERIGYLAVNPNADMVKELMSALVFSLRTLGYVNAPSLMQRAIAIAPNAKVDVAIYKRRRDMLYSILEECGFKCYLPKGAFYLFPQVPGADAESFCNIAAEEHILAVPGDGFGWPGHARFAFCVDEKVIERSRGAFLRLRERLG